MIDLVELKSDFGLKYQEKQQKLRNQRDMLLSSKGRDSFNVVARTTRRIFMTLQKLSTRRGILTVILVSYKMTFKLKET